MKYQTPMTIMKHDERPDDLDEERLPQQTAVGGVGGSTNVLMPSSSTGAGRTTSTCVMSAPLGGRGRPRQ